MIITIAEKVLIMKVLFIFFITFLSALNCSYADIDKDARDIVDKWFVDHDLIDDKCRVTDDTLQMCAHSDDDPYQLVKCDVFSWDSDTKWGDTPNKSPNNRAFAMYVARQITENGALFCPTIVSSERGDTSKQAQNTRAVVKFYTVGDYDGKCFWLYYNGKQPATNPSGEFTNSFLDERNKKVGTTIIAYQKSDADNISSFVPMMNLEDEPCLNNGTVKKVQRAVVLAITRSDKTQHQNGAFVQPVQIRGDRWSQKETYNSTEKKRWYFDPRVSAVRENAEMLFCKHGYVPVNGKCIVLCEESKCRDSDDKCQKVTNKLGRNAHGACEECVGTQSWDSGQMKCVDLTCADNQIAHSGKCINKCPAGQGYNGGYTGDCIACPTSDRGGVGFDGICKKCGANEVYNAEVQSCVELNCDLGQRALNGKCVSECPVGYGFRSDINNECIPCNNDIKRGVTADGICDTCSEDKIFDVAKEECVSAKKITQSKMKACWDKEDFEKCVKGTQQ